MRAAFGALALVLTTACSSDKVPLLERINAFRASPQTCAGKATSALSPLAPSPALATVQIASAQQSLNVELQRVGYAAAQAQAIVLSGPRSAGAAMKLLRERYCDDVTSAQFSEIGISRDGARWVLILAQPLVPTDLGDWREAGREVLDLVNAARAIARTCGAQRFQPAPPMLWRAELAQAALAHSRDMAKGNYFAHAARDGSTVAERAAREGYAWQRIAENLASGQSSPQQAVSAWLASPVHCVNIMQPDFTETGVAYVVNRKSDTLIYWTQVFGTPQR